MNIIENFIKIVAPHHCYVCGVQGFVLCQSCTQEHLIPLPETCYRCNSLSKDYRICKSCRSSSNLRSLTSLFGYEAVAKDLVYKTKFADIQQAARETGQTLASFYFPARDVLVCPVPSSSARIRRRGFDHSSIIATEFAMTHNLLVKPLLLRLGNSRQVGASRRQRKLQADSSYRIRPSLNVKGRSILLIDDVVTTGASIEACAKILRDAGAKHVDGLVFAKD